MKMLCLAGPQGSKCAYGNNLCCVSELHQPCRSHLLSEHIVLINSYSTICTQLQSEKNFKVYHKVHTTLHIVGTWKSRDYSICPHEIDTIANDKD